MGRTENKGRSQPRRLDRLKRTIEIVDRRRLDLFHRPSDQRLRRARRSNLPYRLNPAAMRDFSAGSINLYWGRRKVANVARRP